MNDAETHIRQLLAPLTEKGDGLAFFGSAFVPVRRYRGFLNDLTRVWKDVKWIVNTPEAGSSHDLAGVYEGLEAIGQLFWKLESLFLVDEQRKDMRVSLVDVLASDTRAAVTLVTRGMSKKTGEAIVDHGYV
jgi:hypothetical protein